MITFCWFLVILNVALIVRYFFFTNHQRKAFMALLRQRGKENDEYFGHEPGDLYMEDNWVHQRRAFYCLKAFICMVMGWQKKCYYMEIEVAFWGHHTTQSADWGEGCSWNELSVGEGYFKRWYYTIDWNGWP